MTACDRLVLSVDVPSPLTGTGSKLLLDGEDTALVRASLTDRTGALCSSVARGDSFVTFTIAGPGRVVGTVSGSPTAAGGRNLPTGSSSIYMFGGMASAVVQVRMLPMLRLR